MNYNLKRKIGVAIAAGAIITLAVSNVFADVGPTGKVSVNLAQAQGVNCYQETVGCLAGNQLGTREVCDATAPTQATKCVCGTGSTCEISTIGGGD